MTRHSTFVLASAPVTHSAKAAASCSPPDWTWPGAGWSPPPVMSLGLMPKTIARMSMMMPPMPPPTTMPPGAPPPRPPELTCEVSRVTFSLKLMGRASVPVREPRNTRRDLH
jgi:hypothetical protein